MLTQTDAFLRSHPANWNEGNLAFGSFPNTVGSTDVEAVLAIFGSTREVPALSGQGAHGVTASRKALREIDLDAGRRALVQLLKHEVHMFSMERVEARVLEELAGIFFQEMGAARVYSNTYVHPEGERRSCLGPWTAVSQHTVDTFICAVNRECVAYWLYGDDE